ncbi:MAG TPA: hypothetical protein VIF57_06340 [Polyangia bacterium]
MSRRSVTVVVLVQCAILMAVCLVIGDNGWDDGAITLAFARTFARHGRVALTPGSEVVEGFSSVSWFLLNALIALARPSYRAAIALSQALSVASIGACTVLLARTCALLRFDRLFATLTVVAFAAWGCSFCEAGNGMEMGLLAAACLLIINELLSPQPRLLPLCAGVVLAVTTRFEAVLYVGLLGASVVSVPGRRAFRAIALTGVATVALLTSWRLAVFSDVLPNTFWAKRWPPYAALAAGDRLAGAVELAAFFVGPLLVLALAGATRSGFSLAGAVRARRRAVAVLAAPIVGAVVMGFVTGRHWGYYGRMPYFAFAPALLLLSLLLADWIEVRRSRLRLAFAAGSLASAVAVSMVGLPTPYLRAALAGGAFGVTPHTYAESGQEFRRFAAAAELPHAAILTSDVGGLALCCEEFKIVDLAFLSNRTLAHQGPAAIGAVLDAASPELVEAHWKWAAVGQLYDLPRFRARYAPAFAGRTRLWIRRDVAEGIARRGCGCWLPSRDADVARVMSDHRYATTDLPYDRTSFERPDVVFALSQAEANGNLCGRDDVWTIY